MASEIDTRVLDTVLSTLGVGASSQWLQTLKQAQSQGEDAQGENAESESDSNEIPQADEDTEIPELGDYKTFSWAEGNEDEAVTVELQDGTRFEISREKTPTLFAAVQDDMKAWAKIHDLEDDGYTLRSADDDIPVLGDGDSVESVADDDGNVIEGLKLVSVNGDKYVVAEDITPEHFEAASNFQQLSSADAIDDVFAEHDLPQSDETNLLGQETTVENDDGEAMTVTEVYMDQLKQKLDELKTGQQGRHLEIHDNDFYQDHKKEIDTVLDNWDKWNGSDDIVSKHDLEKIANGRWSDDEAEAAEFLLDDDRSQGLLGMLDTFHKGDGSDGKISSADIDSWMQMIGERAVTEDNPIFERGGEEDIQIDNDELVRDVDQETIDKFEKTIRLLDLKSQLDDGSFQYLPYMTVDHGGDWTYYASDTQGMDPADLRGLIDEEKLGQELTELLGDEEIAKFTDEVMTDAQSKIKDRDALADKIYDSLTGDKGAEYLDAIEELRGQGLGDEAATRLNNDLNTLQALDPDRAAEARGSITAASAARDLEGGLGEIDAEYEAYQDSGDIPAASEETAEQVATDMLPTILTSVTYSTFGVQTSNDVREAVKATLTGETTEPKGATPTDFSPQEKRAYVKIMGIAAGLKEVIKEVALSGSNIKEALKDSSLLSKATNAAMQEVHELTTRQNGKAPKVDIGDTASEKITNNFRQQFRAFMGTNTMFTIGGFAALANAIYRRSGDDFGDTATERMTVARGMLVFIGITPFALKGLTDAISPKLTGDKPSRLQTLFGTRNLTEALGLDKKLGDVFNERFGSGSAETGETKLNPGQEARGKLERVNDTLSQFDTLLDEGRDTADFQNHAEALANTLQTQLNDAETAVRTADLNDEARTQIERQLGTAQDRVDKIVTDQKGLTPQNAAELQQLVDDTANDIRPFTPTAPADRLFMQMDDFLDQFESFKSLLESTQGGKMPADKVATLHRSLQSQANALREQLADTALPEDERKTLAASLDDIDGALEKLDPTQPGGIPDNIERPLETLENAGESARSRLDPSSASAAADTFSEASSVYDQEAERLENGNDASADNDGRGNGASSASGSDKKGKTNVFGPAFKGLAFMTDFAGGILDTVVAGIGLDKAIKSGEPLAISASSTGVGSGAFFTIGGAAEIATSVQNTSRILTSLGSGLRAAGPIGNLIGLGIGFVSLILNAVMAQKKGAETESKIRDQFEQFSDDGVTEADWGDKFNYLINSSYGFKDMMHADDEDKEPDPLFQEWFPEDMAAWEAQPDQYEKFTQEIEENGNVDDFFFDFDQDQMQLNVHGQAFYQENKDTIDTILTNWDEGDGGNDWTGGDDIVSKKDLEKIADPENGHSKQEQDAAQFLLDNEDFFALLDTLHKQDKSDGKISSADIDSWMQLIGERAITDDNPAFADEDSIWDNPASYKL